MPEEILITFMDSTSVTIDDQTFVTCIANDKVSVEESQVFYSKIIYQNYLLNESKSTVSAQTQPILVGIMGLFSSCDYFTLSDDIDLINTVIYKTSAIKSFTLI